MDFLALSSIKTLIDIVSSISLLKNKLYNSERRREIAEWLYEIDNIIEDIGYSMIRKEFPHQTCARMEYIAISFSDVVGNIIPFGEKQKLQDLLNATINIERLYGEFQQLEGFDRTEYIEKLFSISGTILGIADTLYYTR